MIVRLVFATRKFDAPTRRGTLCFRIYGAIIGSGAIYNSIVRKVIIAVIAATREPITVGLSHCGSE